MTEKEKQKLKNDYNNAIQAYCFAFAEKHGFYYDPSESVGQHGEIAVFGDYFVNIIDVIYDIDNNINEIEFEKWYNYTLRLGILEADCNNGLIKIKKVNYPSWCKGYKPYTEEQIDMMEKSMERINELKKSFDDLIKEYNNPKK